jgi:hypothetical protein
MTQLEKTCDEFARIIVDRLVAPEERPKAHAAFKEVFEKAAFAGRITERSSIAVGIEVMIREGFVVAVSDPVLRAGIAASLRNLVKLIRDGVLQKLAEDAERALTHE